jgi:acyl-CoA reductase-like NAD-dependent aldehyde dehydrogenase
VTRVTEARTAAVAASPRARDRGSQAARAGNLIAGDWVPAISGRTYERRNPADLSGLVGHFPDSGRADVMVAAEAARSAFAGWSARRGAERAAVLAAAAELARDRAEEIARDLTRETGKPLREARAEAARLATTLRYFAADGWFPSGEVYGQSLTAGQVYTLRRPVGVVGLITPWNFPVAIPAWKLAPALVTGNTVVLKPPEEAPLSALHLAQCLVDAGLPAGVLNVVVGRGAEAGAELVTRPEPRAISFTGSLDVGRRVRDDATALGKRVQLELGGQNPLVVMADADLLKAVEAAYAGAFLAAGQKCTATRRIFVQEDMYDELRGRLLERMSRAVIGDPTDPRTEVGPLINRRQYDAVVQGIEQGRRQGADVLTGGEHGDDNGYFVSPTLFENVDDAAELAREELFGPVASLFRFVTLEEALARANGVGYGLSAAIFTSALATAQRFAGAVQAGVIRVNSATTGAEVHVPFGGIKASGWGPHEQGRAAIEIYTDVATVYLDA